MEMYLRIIIIVLAIKVIVLSFVLIKKNIELRNLNVKINEKNKSEEENKKELKFLHKRMNEKNKIISSLNKELRVISYNLSHSIKTPLHGINQISQWIQDDYKEDINPDLKELMQLLSGRVEKLNGLINNLLQYTSIKKGKEKNHGLDLDEILKNMISFMEIPKHIQVIFTSKFPILNIEKKYIESIFFNLIDNAVKYMDKSEGYIEIGVIELKRKYIFYIKDNGCGIDEKYHEKVFDMFQSLDDNQNIENMGVGLALTKKIVEIYGGTIRLESKLGEGTTVFFTLPIM